jgi:hypothetical protein
MNANSIPTANAAPPRLRSLTSAAWATLWCCFGAYLLGFPGRPTVRSALGVGSEVGPSGAGSVGFRSEAALTVKPIGDVRVGELVAACDVSTGRLVARRVLQAHRRVSDHLRLLQISSPDGEKQEVRTTDEHPFWVQGRGWVRAGELQVSEVLIRCDGTPATVVATTREAYPRGIPVFNIRVEQSHNYFVRGQGSRAPPVLVHNKPDLETVQNPQLPSIIYRQGGTTPSDFKRSPFSFRDSLSNPINPPLPGPLGKNPVFDLGREYIGVDPSKLPPGSVILDNDPPGHVNVVGVSVQDIKNALISKGKIPR